MSQADLGHRASRQASAGGSLRLGETLAGVVLIEPRPHIANDYGHVFEYLGIRLNPVRSVEQLTEVLHRGRPMGVVWDLAAGLDTGEVLHAVSELDRSLPMLMVAGEDARTRMLLDSMVRFWRMTCVATLTAQPELTEIVEFLFRAGRRSGQFRILSV